MRLQHRRSSCDDYAACRRRLPRLRPTFFPTLASYFFSQRARNAASAFSFSAVIFASARARFSAVRCSDCNSASCLRASRAAVRQRSFTARSLRSACRIAGEARLRPFFALPFFFASGGRPRRFLMGAPVESSGCACARFTRFFVDAEVALVLLLFVEDFFRTAVVAGIVCSSSPLIVGIICITVVRCQNVSPIWPLYAFIFLRLRIFECGDPLFASSRIDVRAG